jgi:hypothetical protein
LQLLDLGKIGRVDKEQADGGSEKGRDQHNKNHQDTADQLGARRWRRGFVEEHRHGRTRSG